MSGRTTESRIAVVLPCYNEELAVQKTIDDFRAVLPHAFIYVIDNNSSDRTAEVAIKAGAEVRREPRRGKGNAVRRALADIEADIYVMADGDGTYDARDFEPMVRAGVSKKRVVYLLQFRN